MRQMTTRHAHACRPLLGGTNKKLARSRGVHDSRDDRGMMWSVETRDGVLNKADIDCLSPHLPRTFVLFVRSASLSPFLPYPSPNTHQSSRHRFFEACGTSCQHRPTPK